MHPTHPRRPVPRSALLVAFCLTAALLSACLPVTDGRPTPTPTPTRTALYASDEEALAAAEKVYREYLDATSSGPDLNRLADVTTPEWFAYEKESAERRAADGLRAEGSSALVSFSLQMRSETEMVAYACIDVSQVRIVNSSGADVTPAERPDRGTLEVLFALTNAGPKVNGSDLWSNSCS